MKSTGLNKKLGLFLRFMPMFVFLAPLYWVPYLSVEVLSWAKLLTGVGVGILAVRVFMVNPLFLIKSKVTMGYLFFIGVSLLYFLLFDNGKDFGPFMIAAILYIFFMMGYCWSIGGAEFNLFGGYGPVFLVVFGVLCLWVFGAAFFERLNIINPLYSMRDLLLLNSGFESPLLSSTGFNIGRTGWAISVFFVCMCIIQSAQIERRKNITYLAMFAVTAGFLSIITTASRGGLVYLFLFALSFGWSKLNKYHLIFKLMWLILMLVAGLIVYVVWGADLRLLNLDGGLTTGRYEGYLESISLIFARPMFGYYPVGGYSLLDYGLEYESIHNAWLHFIVSYGVIMFLVLLICFLSLVVWALLYRDNKNEYFYLRSLIYCGLISTFFEPQTIFSAGYHVLVFWVVLGFLCGLNRRRVVFN